MEPDASDTLAGAQALDEEEIDTFAIDRPGDQDWYRFRGPHIKPNSDSDVTIYLKQPPTGCTEPQPLLVGLHNQERRWIRTYVKTEHFSYDVLVITIRLPERPARYYLHVQAADASCVGLQYAISLVIGAQTRSSPAGATLSDVVLCRIAHNDRVRATNRLVGLKRTHRSLRSRAARRRYTRYVRAQRRVVKQERAGERRTCANVG